MILRECVGVLFSPRESQVALRLHLHCTKIWYKDGRELPWSLGLACIWCKACVFGDGAGSGTGVLVKCVRRSTTELRPQLQAAASGSENRVQARVVFLLLWLSLSTSQAAGPGDLLTSAPMSQLSRYCTLRLPEGLCVEQRSGHA